MSKSKILSLVVALTDTLIILAGGLMLVMIMAMSILIFDSGESWQAWVMFIMICAVCLLLGASAIYTAIRYHRKKRYVLSLIGSAIPLIAFEVLQLVASLVV